MTGKTVTVALADAHRDQLRKFAAETLGITFAFNDSAATMRAKIATVYDKETITIGLPAGGDAPAAKAAPADSGPDGEKAEPWDLIMIDKQETAEGAMPVWLSVNGRGQFVPRGIKCPVRRRYVHVLENAVQTVYDQPEGPKGPMVARQVPNYPWRILKQDIPADELPALMAQAQAA